MIRVTEQQGTAFTMEVEGRQYLITAGHMVGSLQDSDSIQVLNNGQWLPVSVKIFRCRAPIDIAVLVPFAQITPALPFEATLTGAFMGQDVYFLGFPFGLSIPWTNINGAYPIALVKRGTLSAIVVENEAKMILLDGFNNPGFSGGPIVYRRPGDPNVMFYVAGVVAGFHPELVPVTKPVTIEVGQDLNSIDPWRIGTLENGRKTVLRDTDEVVPLNTGIVLGYSIEHAVDLIREHPIGPEVKK